MVDRDGGDESTEADGGTVSQHARDHRETNYLEREVNLLNPSTPFMRDHLRVVWTGFVAWALVVFGPVTLTFVAPGPMTARMPVLGFPLHYFLVAIGAPGGALVLSFWYARKRDRLDEKYGIDHRQGTGTAAGDGSAVAADGGTDE
ncbi:DUF4212 domain-containing protein [Halorarum halophilum]|uniref:DUF4212 domain-containing protein n=1 Tax=Halorarum halophilum TaxID=2743090 RepID=A0A7D5GJ44_9EURY|nr:DUF4212 domain-containing protein [Halobaculum halophilum]QLG28611.1 DUF4212 domain-containing protein [Halobaculum halophilum]